jgi:addiction module HigA family antidote
MEKIPFAYSIHPGDILKTEFMEPLGLSSYRLAKELHVPAPRVNDIVLGKRGITADTAIRLASYFGNSPEFWLGLQMDHDLWVAAKNEVPDPPLPKVKARAQAA